MPLVIVNPTTRRRRKATSTTAPKAKRGAPMAKRRRSPAQKRAFAKMIHANPRRRRRTVHVNPVRHARRRRTIHRNPVSYRGRRRHRNPSTGGFLGSMLDKEGLMLLAAVVATPTLIAEGQALVFPNATGYYAALIQGAIGVGLGWAAYKTINRQVGQVVALIGVGTAVAEVITGYNAGTLSTSKLSGFNNDPVLRRDPVTGRPIQGYPLGGYLPGPRNDGNLGNLHGYGTAPGFVAPREPGMRMIR